MTAAALGAFVVFEDEAGFSMTPPQARTWGRRGLTPSCGSEAAPGAAG